MTLRLKIIECLVTFCSRSKWPVVAVFAMPLHFSHAVSQDSLTNEDLLRTNIAGVPSEAIVAKTQSSPGQCSASVDSLIDLVAGDIDRTIIAALIHDSPSDTDETRAKPSPFLIPLVAALSAIVATLIGAVASFCLTRSRDRDFRTFEVVRMYQDNFQLHARALSHLEEWIDGKQPSPANENEIRLMGNWLDTIAALMDQKRVEIDLAERLGLHRAIRNFHEQVMTDSNIANALDASDWKFIQKLNTQNQKENAK